MRPARRQRATRNRQVFPRSDWGWGTVRHQRSADGEGVEPGEGEGLEDGLAEEVGLVGVEVPAERARQARKRREHPGVGSPGAGGHDGGVEWRGDGGGLPMAWTVGVLFGSRPTEGRTCAARKPGSADARWRLVSARPGLWVWLVKLVPRVISMAKRAARHGTARARARTLSGTAPCRAH